MTVSRRHLFPLAGLAALSPVSVGANELPAAASQGLKISLRLFAGEWEVMVPAQDQKWQPGWPLAIEWMPVQQFLDEVKKEVSEI